MLDGRADESSWSVADWHPLSHVLVGTPVSDEADFSGRYRLLWREDALYLLAEIRDDVLSDGSADPLLDYWADDALEILIDEDASGGGHKANHSAFAYHIALDGEVVDMGEDGQPLRLIEHVESTWRRSPAAPHSLLWEARIRIYPDPAALTPAADWQPRALKASEIMGFSLAYCDSDAPGERRRLIADVEVEAVDGDRNRLYLDAGVFGRIALLP
ncbi:Carbohydrate family 9 binding domain-like [Aquimonas voraii]|uniref:Carbohydrate family 9 binding domain-like n=1 Tax=Aquimonas voraii TaxID=265719 RepID=A0A1G6UNJ6_9GAMM|nr:Carbohydrate family 9 binding domain-like [Aquimonas voraii]